MTDETLESWLAKEIKDAETVYDMYRSYRQSESRDAMVTLSRLHALEEVRSKIGELWGVAVTNGDHHG